MAVPGPFRSRPAVPAGDGPGQLQGVHQLRGVAGQEAFRIEYWALEEAKIRRQPPEKELSRLVALVIGGAGGIGREVARLAAARGAHVFIADRNAAGAARAAAELALLAPPEFFASAGVDTGSREAIREVLGVASLAYGGIDILIDTAGQFSRRQHFRRRRFRRRHGHKL